MSKRMFDRIYSAHMLVHPDERQQSRDPLVAIRSFMDEYNNNLVDAYTPGNSLTIDLRNVKPSCITVCFLYDLDHSHCLLSLLSGSSYLSL
jgi:hypothetical protein